MTQRPHLCSAPFLFAVVLSLFWSSHAAAPHRIARSYEDSVRLVILWNDLAQGTCGDLPHVGQQTLDTVLAALDTTRIRNIRRFSMHSVTRNQVTSAFGTRLPHAVVNLNSGWGANRAELDSIFAWATRNYVGLVDIGDDASTMATKTFGFRHVDNMPQPMWDARWLGEPGDSLWIKTQPSRDRLVDSTTYPFLTGIVRNATLKVLRDSTFHFKPVASTLGPGARRCQADADEYQIDPGFERKVTFLGYQQGWSNRARVVDGASKPSGFIGTREQWNVLAAFQDSLLIGARVVVRRGVALSFQPQFLQSALAAQQLVYDAIMYSSLAHSLRPVAVTISTRDSTIVAGGTIPLVGVVLPADLPQREKDSLAQYIRWSIDPASRLPGDSLLVTQGGSSTLTTTVAHRQVVVIAALYNEANNDTVYTRTTITVLPGPPTKVWIERLQGDSVIDKNKPTEQDLYTLPMTKDTTIAAAVLRDRFGNYVKLADQVSWASLKTDRLAIRPQTGKSYLGVISRVQGYMGPADTIPIVASQSGLQSDSAKVYADFIQKVATPVAHPGGKTFYGSLTLDSLTTATPQAQIWYCINCDAPAPNAPGSSLYQPGTALGPLGNDTVILKAIGVRAGFVNSEVLVERYFNLDSKGPEIMKAIFYLGSPPGRQNTGKAPDTLIVTFSEPVLCSDFKNPPDAVFNVVGAGGVSLAGKARFADGTASCNGNVTTATILVDSGLVQPLRDSLQIKSLRDQYGNVTTNGIPRVIEWGRSYDFIVSVVVNPVTIGSSGTSIIEKLGNAVDPSLIPIQTGTAVKIDIVSMQKLDPKQSSMVLFDAVGNQITNELQVVPSKDGTSFYFFWDGRNRNDRLVGSGTYLGIVKLTNEDTGRVTQTRVRIGVRR